LRARHIRQVIWQKKAGLVEPEIAPFYPPSYRSWLSVRVSGCQRPQISNFEHFICTPIWQQWATACVKGLILWLIIVV